MIRFVALASLLLFVSGPLLADASHAYADAVLDALQKKGILSAQEVSAIKKTAADAEK